MARSPDVLIIGGGVIGLTTAFFLAREKVSVTVVDRGPIGREASWAGAGIIPPIASGPKLDPLEHLRQLSARRFASFSNELKDLTGIDNEYHTCGGFEIGTTAEMRSRWRDAGVDFNFETESRVCRLAYSQVRNPRHLQALVQACQTVGVTIRPDTPIDPKNLPSAGQTLIAAGAWSSAFLPAEFQIPITPVRGQIVLFRSQPGVLNHIVIDGHRYIVPRKDGRVLVGSTEEPEAGFEKCTTEMAIESLKQFAFGHRPELRNATVETAWAGLRPGSRDAWPYLGSVPDRANLFIASGHFRAGLQLSVASGEGMAAMLLGRRPDFSEESFRLDRPPRPHAEPLFRS